MPRKSASKKQRGGSKNKVKNRTKTRSKKQKKIRSQKKRISNKINRKSKKIGGGTPGYKDRMNLKYRLNKLKNGTGIYNETFKKELKSHLLKYGQKASLNGTEAMMSTSPQNIPFVYRKGKNNIMTLNNFYNQTKYKNVIPRKMSAEDYKTFLKNRRETKAAEAEAESVRREAEKTRKAEEERVRREAEETRRAKEERARRAAEEERARRASERIKGKSIKSAISGMRPPDNNNAGSNSNEWSNDGED